MVTIVYKPDYVSTLLCIAITFLTTLYCSWGYGCPNSNPILAPNPVPKWDACFVNSGRIITIQPCSAGGTNISNSTKIDRDFLDSQHAGRSLILFISTPVNIQFDNSYDSVVFWGHARQYYFPKLANRFSYVISDHPIVHVKNLQPSNITGCPSDTYYNGHTNAWGWNGYCWNACLID